MLTISAIALPPDGLCCRGQRYHTAQNCGFPERRYTESRKQRRSFRRGGGFCRREPDQFLLTNGAASVALKDYAGTEKQVSVYAQDYAGNRSETVKFDNPYYEEPEETKETSAVSAVQVQSSTVSVRLVQAQAASSGSTNTSAQSSNSGSTSASTQSGNSGNGSHAGADTGGNAASGTNENGNSANSQEETETASSIPEGAFTPEGTGTVQDSISGEDGEKQFYTITTEAGNVFYLVIDGKRDDNNVYFLNGVTEADLMALAEKGDGSVSVIPAAEACTCTEEMRGRKGQYRLYGLQKRPERLYGKKKRSPQRRRNLTSRRNRRKTLAVPARSFLSLWPSLQ